MCADSYNFIRTKYNLKDEQPAETPTENKTATEEKAAETEQTTA